jgi:hypothetical protein
MIRTRGEPHDDHEGGLETALRATIPRRANIPEWLWFADRQVFIAAMC